MKGDENVEEQTAETLDNGKEGENEEAAAEEVKRFIWEKCSTGVASKIIEKMGYRGKGLGKEENGIVEPILVERKQEFNITNKEKRKRRRKRKMVYVISDSMLNQLDKKKLSGKHDVFVESHGGCKIRCIYTHLPDIIKLEPDVVLLHIGTNDCATKTSDKVLKELENLLKYIETKLPATKLIVSLPIVRSDNKTANQIVTNLNVKLRKSHYKVLDNSNVNFSHLGRKGLHLNEHGTKLMARNIISLIEHL